MMFVSVFAGILLGACEQPTASDLTGIWVNPDGAVLTLEENGNFSAHVLPAQVFLMPDSTDAPLNGKGRWKFEKHNLLWHGDSGMVQLDFYEIPGHPPRTGTDVIVSGSGKSISLYQWMGEEGGARYKLTKK